MYSIIFVTCVNGREVSLALEETDLAMGSDTPYVVVPKKNRSELQTFASWFHQDWELVFPDFYQGAKMYIDSLSTERKKVLKSELIEFINKYIGSNSSEVKRGWLSLGAQAWQSDKDIHKTLNDFVRLM